MNNNEILQLLRSEVIPAIGCTEPIAVALCTARAKELLGEEPDAITVYLSKNVYKNALAVGIPNTGMTGLPIAIALGATVGKSEYMLEVLRDATSETVAYAKEYMALSEREGLVWGVVRTAMSCVSELCVIPMQDLLDLGGEARMNFPGTMTGANWTWRAGEGFADNGLAQRLYELTKLYGRV